VHAHAEHTEHAADEHTAEGSELTEERSVTRKILGVLSEWGYWGEELVGPLEVLDAVGPEGQYHGNFGKETSVIVDYPFITARSTQDSGLCGEKLVEVLERGLTRFGW
jgi:hypothetical protein